MSSSFTTLLFHAHFFVSLLNSFVYSLIRAQRPPSSSLSGGDVDGLALGIVEPVHCVDGSDHSESPVADGGKEERDDDPDPQPDGEDLSAIPTGAELGTGNVVHLEEKKPKMNTVTRRQEI